MVGVEELGHSLSGQLFELVPGIGDELPVGRPHGERTGAEGHELLIAVSGFVQPHVGDDVQSSEVLIAELVLQRRGFAHRCQSVLAKVLDPGRIDEVAPFAGVTLVRGDQVVGAAGSERRDRVGHIRALESFVFRDVHGRSVLGITIGGVESVARRPMVLEPQREDLLHLGRGDVDDRERIRLLQGGIGFVAGDSDVFGLEVARDRQVVFGCGPEDPHILGQRLRSPVLELVEIRGVHVRLRRCDHLGGEVDDGHRPLGIGREIVGRFALVRHQGMSAVGGDRDHVGQGSDGNLAEDVRLGVVRVEEHHGSRLRLVLVLESDDAESVLADGDRVRDTGAGDLGDLLRVLRVRGVDDVDGSGLCVDGEDQVAVDGGDLGGGFVELSGLVGTEEAHFDLRARGR